MVLEFPPPWLDITVVALEGEGVREGKNKKYDSCRNVPEYVCNVCMLFPRERML